MINSSEESDEEKGDELNGDMNMLNIQYTKNIEKSYSNLSKDSGVFGESYHSECSSGNNHMQGGRRTISGGHDHSESTEERVSHIFTVKQYLNKLNSFFFQNLIFYLLITQ